MKIEKMKVYIMQTSTAGYDLIGSSSMRLRWIELITIKNTAKIVKCNRNK